MTNKLRNLLVLTTNTPEQFCERGGADPSLPRYFWNYAIWNGLQKQGVQIEFERLQSLSANRPIAHSRPKGWWRIYFDIIRLARRLKGFDAIIVLGTIGYIISIIGRRLLGHKRNIVNLAYYVTRNSNNVKDRFLNYLTKWGIRQSGKVFFITRQQVTEAQKLVGCRPEQLAWIRAGVDTRYYRPVSAPKVSNGCSNLCSNLTKACSWRNYVVVSGDQLRREEILPQILAGLGIGLVRLTQNSHVEHFWQEQVKQSRVDFPIFCRAHLSAADVRYAYQRALCLLNLTNNSWQPAGWTVMTEAMACGIPVIMNSGLCTQEMKADLAPGEPLPFIEISSIEPDVARKMVQRLKNNSDMWTEFSHRARRHIEHYFTVEMTAEMVTTALNLK